MTTNEQLLGLVLSSRGLQAIADTVAELIGCPIAVEDGRSNLLCWSVKGTRDASRAEELRLSALSSAELWRTPSMRPQLDALRTTMRLVRLPALPCHALPYPRAMTVIAAGARILGYLSALETGEILTEQQCSALEQAAIVFALEFLKQEAAQAVEQRLAGDLLEDLLFRRGEADASLYQRSSRLNVDLHRPHRIVVLDIDAFADAIHANNWNDVQALNVKRRFSSLVGDVTARSAPGTLIGTRSDSVLMLLADTGLAHVKGLLNEIQEALRIPLPDLTVSAGVGRAFEGAQNYARSYMDALMALRTVRSMGGQNETVAFEELGVLPLLLQTEDQDALLAFMQRHLKSLLDYDAEHQTQLVSTLQAYLAQNGNLQRTATSCFVHLNTLKYRLRRIQEISGLELDRGETRFNLQLSLAIYSALNVLRDFGKQQTI